MDTAPNQQEDGIMGAMTASRYKLIASPWRLLFTFLVSVHQSTCFLLDIIFFFHLLCLLVSTISLYLPCYDSTQPSFALKPKTLSGIKNAMKCVESKVTASCPHSLASMAPHKPIDMAISLNPAHCLLVPCRWHEASTLHLSQRKRDLMTGVLYGSILIRATDSPRKCSWSIVAARS